MDSSSAREMAMGLVVLDQERVVLFPRLRLEPFDDVLGGLGDRDGDAARHDERAVGGIARIDREHMLRADVGEAGVGLHDQERNHSAPRAGSMKFGNQPSYVFTSAASGIGAARPSRKAAPPVTPMRSAGTPAARASSSAAAVSLGAVVTT